MKCDKELITHWLNNEMKEAERKAFELHLSGCSVCRSAVSIAEKLTGKLKQVEIPEPTADMERRFQAMLGDYKKSVRRKETGWNSFWIDLYEKLTLKPAFQLAYSFLLLLAGVGVSYLFFNTSSKNNSQTEIAKLSSEVQEMKQLMMLSLLENPSATERLKAVSYTEEINTADEQVIEALLTTLNEDPNVNVRLVTLEALTKYSSNPAVREGLVQSIIKQESPLMQLALADVMMRLQEKKSIEAFRKLLQDNRVSEPIKTKIQQTITTLSI
jgi:hypothetical protein